MGLDNGDIGNYICMLKEQIDANADKCGVKFGLEIALQMLEEMLKEKAEYEAS